MLDGNTISKKGRLESRTFKDGQIYLFRRTDYKKPIWQARIKVPGAKGYIFKTTKTSDEFEAFKVADDLYHRSLFKVMNGGSIREKTFEKLLQEYEAELRSNSLRLHDEYSLHTLEIYAGAYFRSKIVADITQKDIHAFVLWRSRNGRKRKSVTNNTLRCELSYLKNFFDWCLRSGNINHEVKIDKPAMSKNRRPHFDAADWEKLIAYLPTFLDHENPVICRDRAMLCSYVQILANTGIRVGEARNLRWRDVAEVPASDPTSHPNIVLRVKGKTGAREVVAATSVVKTYFKRILGIRKAELGHLPEPNEFVFCHKGGEQIQTFKKSFSSLINGAKVEKDTYGQNRTIYSLRHTYATFRLQEGVHQFLLARNMGTSVAMLEEFYGHTSNIASANELTKSTTIGQRIPQSTVGPLDWLSK